MKIGPYQIQAKVVLAPMAGITDLPFRKVCYYFGAGLTTTEMVTANTRLWKTNKSRNRLEFADNTMLQSVQIVGAEASQLAEAAIACVDIGAKIIDINMGCPAKKVCNVAAGSALLKDELLVAKILETVVKSVAVPVTLKIRTGWDIPIRNAVIIAQIAEQSGIQAIAVHGRTRACKFNGDAEFETIATVKAAINIPVIANGDITSAEQAKAVIEYTQADAVMIGRGAQGNPWIFREITNYLNSPRSVTTTTRQEKLETILQHIKELYAFYGEIMGVKIARKHVNWYTHDMPEATRFRKIFNKIDRPALQLEAINNYFHELTIEGELAA